MEEPSFWVTAFNEAQKLLQMEVDGFAAVLQTIAGFDVVSQAGDVIDIFKGAGAALLTLFFCMEVFTYCAAVDFNGGIESALKVAMKLIVSALIIQNVDNIVGLISGMMKETVDFAGAFDKVGQAFGKAMTNGGELDPGIFDLNLIILTILYAFIIIIMFVMFSMIVISVLGVVMETAILTAISPVALSTLVNSQARSTGISFIKNFTAVSMQWGVLAICFKAYTIISEKLALDFSAGLSSAGLLMHIFKYATPVLMIVVLTTTVSKASEITKRALGG